MGVANTLPNYKSFTFDGTNSRAYGVYITGRGVFNAPERNVEMVEIPGRNGAYALDKGNFNNIEVTYPAGIFADTEADFAQAVSDLRNFLCSKSGYCRLEDDYNSGEYRMAIYKSGLEVDHDMLTAGEFNIVFECKPQRWLTSGETAVSVASGGKVTNPTLFEAKPLLEVVGYGDIDLGGQEIKVSNVPLGNVVLDTNISWTEVPPSVVSFTHTVDIPNTSVLNNGDSIKFKANITYTSVFAADITNIFGANSGSLRWNRGDVQGNVMIADCAFTSSNSLVYGTSLTWDGEVDWTITPTPVSPISDSIFVEAAYDGDHTITFTFEGFNTTTGSSYTFSIDSITAVSTKSALGNLMYIDLDIGEAYKIENGTAVSINNAVQIPAELPVLPPGDTTITYDNTITSFKVLPRWWKV